MVGAWTGRRPRPRPGITLTEILIAIMIMGIGLVSLATLFPIGLLRLRDANRYSRSATLLQTAAADASARGLLNGQSFSYAESFNYKFGFSPWYYSATLANAAVPTYPPSYNPLIQDTAYYGDDPYDTNNPGFPFSPNVPMVTNMSQGGAGLPFAYDPLWRYQTLSTANGTPGYYLGDTYEARFASGIGFIRNDSDGNPPSAHGLPRLTNFNRPYVVNGQNVETPIMPAALFVPNIFVSQEDVVWQDAKINTYTIDGATGNSAISVFGPSPVIPDLNTSGSGTPSIDWRFSWMFTGQQTSSSNASCFDGNIVIFENRPFGIQVPSIMPNAPAAPLQAYQVEGETVVEAVFGVSNAVIPPGGPQAAGAGNPGYGSAADHTVLLRWNDQLPDPVVRVGDWIADVTYERRTNFVVSRFLSYPQINNPNAPGGLQNWANNLEWDNLPPQRCYWYQVQKTQPIVPDPSVAGHRSMTVYVNQSLVSRTVLQGNGQPLFLNAALIAPNVVNVIPQTIFSR